MTYITPGAGNVGSYIQIQDQKATTTNGGSFTSGAWQTRTLNTIVTDETGVVTLTSNQFVLPAGTYRVTCRCPAWAIDRHQARLYNITDSAVVLLGSSENNSNGGPAATNHSFITGTFTIAGSKTFEVQHKCATTGSNGFGLAGNSGATEIFTSIELIKI